MLFRKTRLSWFLVIGVILEITSILYFTFYKINLNTIETLTFSSISEYWGFLVKLIFIAPVIEELIFDSAYLKNKIFKILSLLIICLLTVFVIDFDFLDLFFLVLYIISYLIYFKYKKQFYLTLSLLFNAFLFATWHLDISNLNQEGLTWFISFLSRFGGHLLALWLVINFNILLAILYHFIWNLSVALILVISNKDYYMPQGELRKIHNKNFHIEYQETSLISKYKLEYNDSIWKCQSCKFTDFFKHYGYKNIQQRKPLIYNITINIKNYKNQSRTESIDDLKRLLKGKEIITVKK